MHASLDTGLVQENQAIRLRVDLIGNGNMEHFTFPKPEFPEGFEIFEPKVKNAYELNKDNYKGSRIWEYVLIPSKPGTFSFEDVRFTYFSPQRKDYRTLRVPLQKLRVLSHNELAGDYASSPISGKVRTLSEDIRFIQTEESKLPRYVIRSRKRPA
ncbi:MAG: BatD family protein [Candidatus Marinimicrobia bacterium]|nr:BatD family protein [Candidatus Neomarinimicrobiota bacterium]